VALEFDPVLKTNVKHVEGERTLRVFDIW
jgi:hypothetical protein